MIHESSQLFHSKSIILQRFDSFGRQVKFESFYESSTSNMNFRIQTASVAANSRFAYGHNCHSFRFSSSIFKLTSWWCMLFWQNWWYFFEEKDPFHLIPKSNLILHLVGVFPTCFRIIELLWRRDLCVLSNKCENF